jgi:hypothetical protein
MRLDQAHPLPVHSCLPYYATTITTSYTKEHQDKLDTWTAYCDFMASPVVNMGDSGIIAHFEFVRKQLQAHPYANDIYYLL